MSDFEPKSESEAGWGAEAQTCVSYPHSMTFAAMCLPFSWRAKYICK